MAASAAPTEHRGLDDVHIHRSDYPAVPLSPSGASFHNPRAPTAGVPLRARAESGSLPGYCTKIRRQQRAVQFPRAEESEVQEACALVRQQSAAGPLLRSGASGRDLPADVAHRDGAAGQAASHARTPVHLVQLLAADGAPPVAQHAQSLPQQQQSQVQADPGLSLARAGLEAAAAGVRQHRPAGQGLRREVRCQEDTLQTVLRVTGLGDNRVRGTVAEQSVASLQIPRGQDFLSSHFRGEITLAARQADILLYISATRRHF